MRIMKLFFASDHAGFLLKNCIISALLGRKCDFEIVDYGCDSSTNNVDYPDYAKKISTEVAQNTTDAGILICNTGIGMCIAANRFQGVRAALCTNLRSTELSRRHNNANVLCIGASEVSESDAIAMVEIFIKTEFEKNEKRHSLRLQKIEKY